MYPSKLLYPFYLIKEIVYLPDKALNDQDISFSCEFKNSIINNLNEEIDSLKKLNNISLSISKFNKINATIIERNREYRFNTININKI